jgi:hypothetical protein
VWLLVAERGLSATDRWHVSRTCRRLQASFSHASFWRLLVLEQNVSKRERPELAASDVGILRTYGRHVHSLVVASWECCEEDMEEESFQALVHFAHHCINLVVVDLDLSCTYDEFQVSARSGLVAVMRVLHHAPRMTCLVVRNWPLHLSTYDQRVCLNVTLPRETQGRPSCRLVPRPLQHCLLHFHDFELGFQEVHVQAGFFANFSEIASLTMRAYGLTKFTLDVLTEQTHLCLKELVLLLDECSEDERDDILLDPLSDQEWLRVRRAFTTQDSKTTPFTIRWVSFV